MFKGPILVKCLSSARKTVVTNTQRSYGRTLMQNQARGDIILFLKPRGNFTSSFISQGRTLSSDSALAMQSKIFSFLSESPLTGAFKNYVLYVHDYTGLPWWATVVFSTFLLRTFITLPLAIYQARIIAKVENIARLEMPDISEKVQRDTALKAKDHGWPPPKAKLYYRLKVKEEWTKLIIRDNCHPFKATATLWVQLPTWIFFSSALRNMVYMLPVKTVEAQVLYMKLAVGGFLWIPNLAQPDGLLILPIILGLSNLAIIEIQALTRIGTGTRLQRYATNFFRCFSVALIPISATVPSILCLYWTSSSILGLCQNLLIMNNKLRRTFKVPDTPSTFDHPYQQLYYEIKQKVPFQKTSLEKLKK